MKIALFSTLLLPLLLSCGEDYGKGRRPTVSKQPGQFVTAELGIPAYLHRDNNESILSSKDAINYLLDPSTQTNGIRSVPLMEKDDEGSSLNVKTLDSAKGRPGVVCGIKSELTLQGRISDCAEKNKEKAIWEATKFGASGESDWKLVARDSFGLEVWLDMRTNMLWADASEGATWCEASGNTQEKCLKDLSNFENRICQNVGKITNISWRLPTRNDFLQADLDGMRFVLPVNVQSGYWTATLDSKSVLRELAWVYKSEQGTLESRPIGTDMPVRCIGAMKI